MTGGVNCGGGHCTRLREQLMCFGVPPAPVLVGFAPLFPSIGGGKGEGEGVGEGKGGAAPFPSPIRPPPLWGARQPLVGWLASLLWPIWPIYFPSGNPSGTPVCTRYTPEPFRCPNTTFQYINLYLSTISRLLVMSVISSGTPNKLRSSNHITHNTNRHRTLSVRTLQVRELCRHA